METAFSKEPQKRSLSSDQETTKFLLKTMLKSLHEISLTAVADVLKMIKKKYDGDSRIKIFSKSDNSNRKDFGLNEILHDVLVCKVDEVESSVHKKKLCFIKEVLWQVESEFAHNTRSSLVDFNKLILGLTFVSIAYIIPHIEE